MRSRSILWALIALPWVAIAHDIPNDVTVQTFLRPAGDKLDLLVRVPLKSMRDTDFPKLGPGYLDIARADQYLQDAAIVWLATESTIDRLLPFLSNLHQIIP